MSQKERDAFVAGADFGDRNRIGNHAQAEAEALRRYLDEKPAPARPKVDCEGCGGSGKVHFATWDEDCRMCGGSGKQFVPPEVVSGPVVEESARCMCRDFAVEKRHEPWCPEDGSIVVGEHWRKMNKKSAMEWVCLSCKERGITNPDFYNLQHWHKRNVGGVLISCGPVVEDGKGRAGEGGKG
jgi:hypothetical protein